MNYYCRLYFSVQLISRFFCEFIFFFFVIKPIFFHEFSLISTIFSFYSTGGFTNVLWIWWFLLSFFFIFCVQYIFYDFSLGIFFTKTLSWSFAKFPTNSVQQFFKSFHEEIAHLRYVMRLVWINVDISTKNSIYFFSIQQ